MKFSDRPIHAKRFNRPTEVEALRLVSHGKDEFDFTFEYALGDEERVIRIELTRAESMELIKQLTEALEDKDYD